eukprot:7226614-Prymnesium_polylepis.1
MRAILSAQSDGKSSSCIQQVLAASLRKQDRAHRTRPGEKRTLGGQWSRGSFPSRSVPLVDRSRGKAWMPRQPPARTTAPGKVPRTA